MERRYNVNLKVNLPHPHRCWDCPGWRWSLEEGTDYCSGGYWTVESAAWKWYDEETGEELPTTWEDTSSHPGWIMTPDRPARCIEENGL